MYLIHFANFPPQNDPQSCRLLYADYDDRMQTIAGPSKGDALAVLGTLL